MSASRTSRSALKLLLFSLLVTALGFCGVRFLDLRQQYYASLEDLAAAQSRSPQILALRQKPDRAARESRSQVALAKVIEESATQSGIKAAQIVSIEPQSPRRVADTQYEEYATLVRVEGATLAELAKLVVTLRGQNTGNYPLSVSSLRIAVPFQAAKSTGEATEAWNIELTLTYLVYSPKSRPS